MSAGSGWGATGVGQDGQTPGRVPGFEDPPKWAPLTIWFWVTLVLLLLAVFAFPAGCAGVWRADDHAARGTTDSYAIPFGVITGMFAALALLTLAFVAGIIAMVRQQSLNRSNIDRLPRSIGGSLLVLPLVAIGAGLAAFLVWLAVSLGAA